MLQRIFGGKSGNRVDKQRLKHLQQQQEQQDGVAAEQSSNSSRVGSAASSNCDLEGSRENSHRNKPTAHQVKSGVDDRLPEMEVRVRHRADRHTFLFDIACLDTQVCAVHPCWCWAIYTSKDRC